MGTRIKSSSSRSDQQQDHSKAVVHWHGKILAISISFGYQHQISFGENHQIILASSTCHCLSFASYSPPFAQFAQAWHLHPLIFCIITPFAQFVPVWYLYCCTIGNAVSRLAQFADFVNFSRQFSTQFLIIYCTKRLLLMATTWLLTIAPSD